MILVLLGTQNNSFTRLLEAVQENIDKKIINDEVVVQAGFTKFESKDMKIFKLIDKEKISKLQDKANIIITHGGVGSIISSLEKVKKVIVVPRLKKYNEHVDDHQQQIAYGFSKKEIVLESDCSNLKSVLDKAQEIRLKEYKFNNKVFIHKLNDILDGME